MSAFSGTPVLQRLSLSDLGKGLQPEGPSGRDLAPSPTLRNKYPRKAGAAYASGRSPRKSETKDPPTPGSAPAERAAAVP